MKMNGVPLVATITIKEMGIVKYATMREICAICRIYIVRNMGNNKQVRHMKMTKKIM